MTIVQSSKRNTPTTVNGYSLTVTTTFFSYNSEEIDVIEEYAPKGFATTTMDCEKIKKFLAGSENYAKECLK